MNRSPTGVTVLGGGEAEAATVAEALRLAPFLVCADGGADTALKLGRMPDLIIGDLDSLSASAARAIDSSKIIRIEEQNSTDFDKCVRSVDAPFFIALGVASPRIDHALESLSVILRRKDRKIALLTGNDFCFLGPPQLSVELPPATRLSLFPMAPAAGRSSGLRWPIDGLRFGPSGQTGASNETVGGRIRLEFTDPAMIVIVPSEYAAHVLPAFLEAPAWGSFLV